MMKEMEATYFLVGKKNSLGVIAGSVLVILAAAGFVGWLSAKSALDHDFARQTFYQPDSSPPLGERLKDGPALVRSGGILLLSYGSECPLGSVQLSDVAIQVIKQGAVQYTTTARGANDSSGWERLTFKTCKI